MRVLIAMWTWFKGHIWESVSAFLGGLAVVLGIAFLFQKRASVAARDEARISQLQTKLAEFEARSKVLQEQDVLDEAEVEKIREQRQELKATVEEARNTAGMSDQEALDAFARLGY